MQQEDGTKLVCKAVDVSAASSKETQDGEDDGDRSLLNLLSKPMSEKYGAEGLL